MKVNESIFNDNNLVIHYDYFQSLKRKVKETGSSLVVFANKDEIEKICDRAKSEGFLTTKIYKDEVGLIKGRIRLKKCRVYSEEEFDKVVKDMREKGYNERRIENYVKSMTDKDGNKYGIDLEYNEFDTEENGLWRSIELIAVTGNLWENDGLGIWVFRSIDAISWNDLSDEDIEWIEEIKENGLKSKNVEQVKDEGWEGK